MIAVDREGRFALDDGRTVRLFGVRPPEEGSERERGLTRLRRLVGVHATVEDLLPGDPPAVRLLAWEPVGHCGHAPRTWNPFAGPFHVLHVETDVA